MEASASRDYSVDESVSEAPSLAEGAGIARPPKRLHKCTYCDKAYLKSSKLTQHIRKHTGEVRDAICYVARSSPDSTRIPSSCASSSASSSRLLLPYPDLHFL